MDVYVCNLFCLSHITAVLFGYCSHFLFISLVVYNLNPVTCNTKQTSIKRMRTKQCGFYGNKVQVEFQIKHTKTVHSEINQ